MTTIVEKTQSCEEKNESPKEPVMYNYDEALDLTEYGRFNIVMLLVCGGCLMIVQLETLSAGYVIPAAQCDFQLSEADKGLVTSICFIGIICSSHFWGFLADTKGRKKVIIFSLFTSFLCTLVSSFVAQLWLFVFLRFCTGFFLAATSGNTYAYLGEFHGIKHRAKSIAWASALLALGLIILPILGWLIIPMEWSLQLTANFNYKPWRLFILLCGLPSLLMTVVLIPLPESPKFLLLRGRRASALEVLKKVYVANTGKQPQQYPVQDLAETLNVGESIEGNASSISYFVRLMWSQTKPLFKPPHLCNTALTCFLQFGTFAICSGVLLWFPDIVNRMADQAKQGNGSDITVCQALTMTTSPTTVNENNSLISFTCTDTLDPLVFQQNLIVGVAYFIGFIVLGSLVNALGKKFLLVICQVIASGAGVLLLFVDQMFWVQVLFIAFLLLSGLCVALINMAVIDVFPTYLRGMAVCVTLSMGRLGSVAASSVMGVLITINCEFTFLTLVGLLLLTGAMSFLLPKGTTESK